MAEPTPLPPQTQSPTPLPLPPPPPPTPTQQPQPQQEQLQQPQQQQHQSQQQQSEQQPQQDPAPAPAPAPPPPPQQPSKKRKVDNAELQHNSKYFKIRAIVKDLRPSFIEVLRAADFQNSKAAHEIRKQMQIMMELYKQLRVEMASIEKSKKQPEAQHPRSKSGEQPLETTQEEKKRSELPQSNEVQENASLQQEKKQTEQPQTNEVQEKAAEEKPSREKPSSDKTSNKQQTGGIPSNDKPSKKQQSDGGISGSYVIGSSPIGWNFMMFPGSSAVFYGVTKANRLARLAMKSSTQ